jgi:hypothetical protein
MLALEANAKAKATEGKVENGDGMEELEWKVEKSSHVTLIYNWSCDVGRNNYIIFWKGSRLWIVGRSGTLVTYLSWDSDFLLP